jgi:soluble epoxide hydrolase / lipid-phosphate phosphatase
LRKSVAGRLGPGLTAKNAPVLVSFLLSPIIMILRIIVTGLLFSVFNLCSAAESFNPREYPKRRVTCPALHRNGGQGEHTETEITMSTSSMTFWLLVRFIDRRHTGYVDINPNAERTLLFVHGWPGLWSTWSNQIMHFKDKYHLVVPNLRGTGDSSHPGDVQA